MSINLIMLQLVAVLGIAVSTLKADLYVGRDSADKAGLNLPKRIDEKREEQDS